MKSEDIYDAMNEINEEYIESANNIRKTKHRKSNFIKWISTAAAIFAVIIGIGLFGHSSQNPISLSDNEQDEPNNFVSLPILEYKSENSSAHGFEGYLAYDISELDNGNPYNENMKLSTLPVYENKSYNFAAIAYPGIGEDAMFEKLQNIADACSFELEDVVKSTIGEIYGGADIPSDAVCSIKATTDTFTVEVSSSGNVVIYYSNDGVELPDDLSFTYTETSEEDAYKAISYICQNYCEFLDKGNTTFFTSGDYTFDGEFTRNYSIYDFSGDDISDILNFSFNRIQLAPTDSGNLMLIRINSVLDCGEKIGDYPIISPDEAEALLISRKYVTSVPFEFPGKENIARVEIIYRNSLAENIWMPYYRFLVEIPEAACENGLKTYGAYYVPAVELKYISGLELWMEVSIKSKKGSRCFTPRTFFICNHPFQM